MRARLSQFPLSFLRACPTLTFLLRERSAAICVVLGTKKSSTYSSEYAPGFSRPAASHLAAPPSPRYEGNAEQTPGQSRWAPRSSGELHFRAMPSLPVSLQLTKNRKATGRLQACRLNASPRSVSCSGSYCPTYFTTASHHRQWSVSLFFSLTFDRSGGWKRAKSAGRRPLDGRVRHRLATCYRRRCSSALASQAAASNS